MSVLLAPRAKFPLAQTIQELDHALCFRPRSAASLEALVEGARERAVAVKEFHRGEVGHGGHHFLESGRGR